VIGSRAPAFPRVHSIKNSVKLALADSWLRYRPRSQIKANNGARFKTRRAKQIDAFRRILSEHLGTARRDKTIAISSV